MYQVSRANHLKIPKKIELVTVKANCMRMDSLMNKSKREQYQKETIVKLKLLGYMALVAENANCILKKQYQQISFSAPFVLARVVNNGDRN